MYNFAQYNLVRESRIRKNNKMQETYIYELIDITFENPYSLIEEEGSFFVREDEVILPEEKPANIIEYDADGIPMGGSQEEKLIRRKKIHDFLQTWRATHADSPRVFNIELQEYIKISQVFLLESVAHSAIQYKSTKAVLMMEEVMKNARKVAMTNVKEGNKNQKPFTKMMVMQYTSSELGKVKMTVGIRKRTLENVQYSITVPTPDTPFIDEALLGKKKAKHKKRKKRP